MTRDAPGSRVKRFPPRMEADRKRRLQNQRDYPDAHVECPLCADHPGRGGCTFCLDTRLITKGTARFMEFGFERGVV